LAYTRYYIVVLSDRWNAVRVVVARPLTPLTVRRQRPAAEPRRAHRHTARRIRPPMPQASGITRGRRRRTSREASGSVAAYPCEALPRAGVGGCRLRLGMRQVHASLRDRTPSPPPAAAARELDVGNAADAHTRGAARGHKRRAASSPGVDDASPHRRRRDDPAASRIGNVVVDNDDDGGADAVDESGIAAVDLQPSAADRDESSAPAYSSVVDKPLTYSSVVNDAAAALRAQLSPSSRHACQTAIEEAVGAVR
jgi:hypothetical protein